jgi:internalin A
VLIALQTPEAATSEYVRSEIRYFLDLGRRVLPIVFGGSEYLATELQHIQALREDYEALSHGPSQRALDEIVGVLPKLAGAAQNRPPVPWPEPAKRKSNRAGRHLNEGKLILVGRGGVGKTSLARRLIHDEFDTRESKTEGIKIDVWQLPVGGDVVRLNVWDFGGQEIMHATHQFFLTEKSIYLLVLHGREGREDTDAEYWLRHIQGFGGDSPVIVIQNKMREHPFELNYRGLQVRYPQIRGFVKTDCGDATGIAEVREQIRGVIEQIPDIRMKLPADWYAIKERLEAKDADFMGYEAFREICAKEGVTDESDRSALAFVLHCLGIALNYRSDSRLRETSVLKPEWVTEGIYKMLNAQQLAHRHGELRLDDLAHLLPSKRYPAEKHVFLLDLMRKFSLCFAFPDSQDRYLVPDLLGKEEPEEAAEFAPAACLNFEYHYEVLPEGLIPRFIVRSHTLSRGRPRWRSGVVLAHEGCRALVASLPLERRIVVRVLGGNARARRELLAIIRYDLDRLNAEFKDSLGATARVPLLQHPAHSVEYAKLVAFERQGVREFPEYIQGQVVKVVVEDLLSGVDLEADPSREREAFAGVPMIFFSYAHEDEALRDELETHLKLLQRQRVIASWHDRKILPGGDWDKEIDNKLEAARIILLLVSADFLASDYSWEKEVARAIERHNNGDARVVPVILRSCDWEGTPFAKLQGLPEDMKPVKSWPDRDSAWTNVAKGIRKLAQSMAR